MEQPTTGREAPRGQPYQYRRPELIEPDWRRLPGYARVSEEQWRDARWQRRNSVTTVAGLVAAFGRLMQQDLANSIAMDQQRLATMALRVTPQVLNTMDESNLWEDPVRRYSLPAAADRDPVWHTHPESRRDSLHEADMSVVEGLVHRYPTKVLVELAPTCPVYCGHCTRMDLIGPSVPAIPKRKLNLGIVDRLDAALSYLAATPAVRDVVISGGDVANVPLDILEAFIARLTAIGNIRSIRLATKALIVLPQYFLQDSVLRSYERIVRVAEKANVDIALHTHCNTAKSITPLVAEATSRLRNVGFHHLRNQGVLMRRVNDSAHAVLDLCFAMTDGARIMPYYFYLMDMIPHGEHWRIPLHHAQRIQEQIMGYLSGFATPRIVCDVPLAGKRWVHQATSYDRKLGISYWSKDYLTPLDNGTRDPSAVTFRYFDPVVDLSSEGQEYWSARLGLSMMTQGIPHPVPPALMTACVSA